MLPRTKVELIEWLNARGIRLRRRDGQNFLIESKLADAIVSDAGVTSRDSVVEIGPGAGALTIPLLHRAGRVTSVEIDRGLVELLRPEFGPDPRLRLVHGDALDGPEGLHPDIVNELDGARAEGFERVIVVANLPYSVGTEVVIRLLTRERPPDAITVMLQAEVVGRIVAKPRTEAYGPLAVLVALTSRVRTTRRIGPRAFFPQPEVDSVVVRIDPDPAKRAAGDVRGAVDLARKAFLQRRKKLLRALEGVASEEAIVRAGIDPAARAETVSPADWLRLAASCAAPAPPAEPGS
jgi:16S rRNA (adenine1518-N6/adenine1519-N6)-dimethyltransferase